MHEFQLSATAVASEDAEEEEVEVVEEVRELGVVEKEEAMEACLAYC